MATCVIAEFEQGEPVGLIRMGALGRKKALFQTAGLLARPLSPPPTPRLPVAPIYYSHCLTPFLRLFLAFKETTNTTAHEHTPKSAKKPPPGRSEASASMPTVFGTGLGSATYSWRKLP